MGRAPQGAGCLFFVIPLGRRQALALRPQASATTAMAHTKLPRSVSSGSDRTRLNRRGTPAVLLVCDCKNALPFCRETVALNLLSAMVEAFGAQGFGDPGD